MSASTWPLRALPATVHWVRHGENLSNVAGQFSNRRIDEPLTERGEAQAARAAAALAGGALSGTVGGVVGPAPVFASPLLRARRTAEIVAARLGRPVEVLEGLREIDVGELEGRSDPESLEIFWTTLQAWRDGDRERRFPGGENLLELSARLRSAIDRAAGAASGTPVVMVAHAGLLRAGLFPLAVQAPPMKLPIANCSISTLHFDAAGRLHIAPVAAADHLEAG